MKTFDGKNVTKKHIQEVLRSKNRNEIFKLHKQVFGNAKRHKVFLFIFAFAPNENIKDSAYHIAYEKEDKSEYTYEMKSKSHFEYIKANPYQHAMSLYRSFLEYRGTGYFKTPKIIDGYLCFVHPQYVERDYNKTRVMQVKGHERFCETLVKLADKHLY